MGLESSGERRYIRRLRVHGAQTARAWPFTSVYNRAKWISGTYDQFNWSHRRQAFLAIARYCELNELTSGYYFEFGSYLARTFRLAYDAFARLYDFKYVAFDSFEGLPDVTGIDVHGKLWYRGKMRTSEESFVRICRQHGLPVDRFRTVRGYYEDSLTTALRDELAPMKAVVIYIDCDLYASAVPVLRFIRDFLQVGTVIVFDDWFLFYGDPWRGERRAFSEFCSENVAARFEPFYENHELKSYVYLGES